MASISNPEPIVIADFSSGMIDEFAVAKALMPRNAVLKAINCVFNRPRGAIAQRNGTTLLGSTVSSGNTALGLHDFRSTTGSAHRLFAAFNGSIFSYDGVGWGTAITGLSTSKTRFITFLDRCVAMNGSQVRSWNGSSFLSTSDSVTDIDNWPITKFATLINGRVLAAGNSSNPDLAYLSSIVSTSDTISWTSGNKTERVFPNDGSGGITSVTGNGRVALIFKQRGLYRYDGDSLQRVGFIGTPSHESVVTDDNGITYFFGQGANGVGFYRTQGGQIEKISRPIQRWVDAIAGSFYDDVAAYTDGQIIEWSVGSITIDGLTYSNASFVYFISDGTWAVFNRADSFRVFSQYIDSNSNITVVGADTDGAVQTINSGSTDNTAPINSEVEFLPVLFSSRGRSKFVTELVTLSKDYQGLAISGVMDSREYQEIGSLVEKDQRFQNLPYLRGHELFLKIVASNSGVPWVFEGFEFPETSVHDEGYTL